MTAFEPDQRVQLGEQLVEWSGRLLHRRGWAVGAGLGRGLRGRRGLELGEEHAAEALDAEQLGVAGVAVDRRDDVADGHRQVVVGVGVGRLVTLVEPAEDLEQGRGHVEERARAGGEPGVADVGGRGLEQRDVETG